MSEIRYPLRFKSKRSGDVYDFDCESGGILVEASSNRRRIGKYSNGLVKHTDNDWWELVVTSTNEAKRRKLHDAIGDYRGL